MSIQIPIRPGDEVGRLLKELGLTVTAGARHLGVTRQALNNLINTPRTSVSPEMALRLEAVFGAKAENWLSCRRPMKHGIPPMSVLLKQS